MCSAVSLPLSELPLHLHASITGRILGRGGDPEVRFHLNAVPAFLPVWWGGKLQLLRWGNRDRSERRLPPSAWTWRETLESGKWADLPTERVDIPARFLFVNGVWTMCKEGVRGLLVRTPSDDLPVVYLICQPATRYWEVMTRAKWMPVLIGEII